MNHHARLLPVAKSKQSNAFILCPPSVWQTLKNIVLRIVVAIEKMAKIPKTYYLKIEQKLRETENIWLHVCIQRKKLR